MPEEENEGKTSFKMQSEWVRKESVGQRHQGKEGRESMKLLAKS